MASFTPRLTPEGIYESKYYYAENPYYLEGNGMPNCTAYAWGRFYEITKIKPDNLPLGNGGEWYPKAVAADYYKVGDTPRLGAVICYSSKTDGAGHVAIVEQINEDGSFVISQSGYYRPLEPYPPDTPHYFSTKVCDGDSKLASTGMADYNFQGFIYNTRIPVKPQPGNNKKKSFIFFGTKFACLLRRKM